MPKKTGKKSGKKKKKAAAKNKETVPAPECPAGHDYCRSCRTVYSVNTATGSTTVKLRIKLLLWSFLDFDLEVPIATTIRSVKEYIRSKYGGSMGSSFRVWLHKVGGTNAVADEFQTLQQLGVDGTEEQPVKVYYEYDTPCDHPLLSKTLGMMERTKLYSRPAVSEPQPRSMSAATRRIRLSSLPNFLSSSPAPQFNDDD